MEEKINTVKTLLEALPFIKKFRDKIVVIKYGGSAQSDPELKKRFAKDIALLYLVGIKPVIVHGGGAKISSILNKLDIETEFFDGQRVTTKEVMEVVEMVLGGSINSEITTFLNHHGIKAIGINGKDANFIKAKHKDREKFGYTGVISKIKNEVIEDLIDEKFVPVIAPIASGDTIDHIGYNINADLAASKIARSIGAEKVLFLTDTAGVLDKNGDLIPTLTTKDIDKLKKDGTISGGMIPKVDACLEAINYGVKKAHIIDGRIEHSILLEIFTSNGIGTVIKKV